MKKDTDVASSSEWKKGSLTTVGLLYSHGSVRYEWNRLLTNFAEFSYMCQCLLSCRYNMLKSQHCCFLHIISRSTVYSLLHTYFFLSPCFYFIGKVQVTVFTWNTEFACFQGCHSMQRYLATTIVGVLPSSLLLKHSKAPTKGKCAKKHG